MMMDARPVLAGATTLVAVLLASGAAPVAASAQWVNVHEQTYLPASHNWAFRRHYAFADLLFNAFDYGHAVLYETLYTRPDADPALLERRVYDRLSRKLLVRPPHVPLEEAAVMIQYARLVPEATLMFDWAHVLHRQTYDVWADESIPLDEKDRRIAEVLAYYLSRPDLAFSTTPKSMELMDGQYYSLAFRERFPRFNGLIWAYHWLQVGLYEPLLEGTNVDERQALAQSTVARFWQMLADPPNSMPFLMPMTAVIAPRFSARYPEIAVVFDNLHMMHDVVSDILASPAVPRSRKRAEILRAIELFRDDTSYVTTLEEWRAMAAAMGVHNQGGPATGFVADLPTPTVPRGMSMAEMTAGGGPHDHSEQAPAADPHAGHQMEAAGDSAATPAAAGNPHRELLDRLLADPAIRARIEADAELRAARDSLDHSAAPAP